jgi:hypothetical protein
MSKDQTFTSGWAAQSGSISLFDELINLGLPVGEYAVFGSGPLAARGIIPLCNDLDVLCRGRAWRMVRALGTVQYLPEYDLEVVAMHGGALTFGTRWGIGDFDVDELINTAEIIGGLPFVRLEHVTSYKKTRGSAKDLAHLEALMKSEYG